jgi:mannitol-specific phosphotransferase system IIBC component
MICMLGTLGLLGCVVGIVVGAVVGVGAVVTSACVGAAQIDQAEKAAADQKEMMEEAENKATKRAEHTKEIQSRINAQNILKAKQAIGGSIAYDRLLTERSRREAARIRHETAEGHKSDSAKYHMGSPSRA